MSRVCQLILAAVVMLGAFATRPIEAQAQQTAAVYQAKCGFQGFPVRNVLRALVGAPRLVRCYPVPQQVALPRSPQPQPAPAGPVRYAQPASRGYEVRVASPGYCPTCRR